MSAIQETQIEAVAQEIPAVLPVLPLRDTVVFPDTMIPLTIGQERSIKLIDDVLAGDRLLAMVTSRDAEIETPGPDLLYPVGTVGLAHKMIKLPDGTMRILVQGLQRVRVKEYVSEEPYLVARTEKIEDVATESKESEALRASLLSVFSKIVALVPYLPEELEMAAANVEGPGPLTFLIASTMRIKAEDKQALLEEDDVEARMRKLIGILTRELDVLELGSKIQSDVRGEIDKSQREYFLRQQMRAIQQELGETDEQEAEINELRQKVEELALPEEADKAARRELDRLSNISPQSAEYPVIRTYLDWIITLPWNVHSEDNLDVAHAREILDRDHYDLEKVKDRILEFLAVRKLKDDLHGPILCFVGPPGVGKTSLGHSIAEAMGRKFERISVGGVRDEAEIRGHRRTYVGAMPGIIVRAMRDAGTNNPLFMIDEIDKMGADWRGDPSSAMLEVLDPEQNVTFRDHYMDLPFDLSRVLFITTANQLEPDPRAAARPHGDHQPRRLHHRGEAPHRAQVPGAPADRGQRTQAGPGHVQGRGDRRDHLELHARGRRAQRRARDRHDLPQARPRGGGGEQRQPQALHRQRQARARPARPAARLQRRQAAHQRPGRGHRPRLDAGGRRHPLHRGDGDARQRPPHRDRPARRRHEGVGDGGDELRAHALAGAGPGGRLLPDARHPHPRAGRGDPQGRAQRRRDHGQRDLLAGHRHAGQQRRRHDRRGHADRSGAAHRRPQGEDPRRAARRHHHGDPAQPQRGRPRGRARGAAQGHDVHPRGPRRAGLGGRHGPQARRTRRAAHRGRRPHRGGRRAAREGAAQGRNAGGRGRQRACGRQGGRQEAGEEAGRQAAAKKPAARKPAPAAQKTARPKAAPAKPKGAAKKTTAARGRSGRKK